MVTLYLLRHGKAKSAANLEDIARPLAERGHQDADAMGARLAGCETKPSLVLCSTAQRARETLAGVLPHLDRSYTIEIEEGLYTFEQEVVLKRLQAIPKAHAAVLFVGHNPALETLTGSLCADGTPSAMKQLAIKFPTCALAELRFTTDDWASIGPKSGRLMQLATPNSE